MSKLEYFLSICIGFAIYTVIFIRVGFLLGYPVQQFSLIISAVTYYIFLTAIFALLKTPREVKIRQFISLGFFTLFLAGMVLASIGFSRTFDTSWDGQGYHQTAIIALVNGWNPVWEADIRLNQRLPSQIFAEGYPPALWEIHAAIYSFSDMINSAKVLNLAVAVLAWCSVYILLRKLKIEKILSLVISIFVVIQPVFLIQLLTYMADGFGYQMLLIAISSLIIIAISSKSYWAIATFIMAQIFLVSTKYSNLPVVLILACIFVALVMNRFLNKEYTFTLPTKIFIGMVLIVSILFAYLPYGRNVVFHRAMLYPTNIPELSGSIRYNNVPSNLQDKDRATLLFYGIFSRTQSAESGDPRGKANVARLKIPFSYSPHELSDTVSLYNNRVGAGGPLFSGSIVAAIMVLLIVTVKSKTKKERYVMYAMYFTIALILVLALVTPSPNLLRYVYQLQLLPFVVLIPVYAAFSSRFLKILSLMILAVVMVNVALYSFAVGNRAYAETQAIHQEFTSMRNAHRHYKVRAQNFYSSYILLKENNVPFSIVDKIPCQDIHELIATSTTTQYCID